MKEMFVFMLTTGKIIEESRTFSTTQRTCARTGIQRASLHLTKMDVLLNISALTVMDGKNKSFILTTSK